jgi:Tfp pilus assembly protein PilN
MIAINLLPEDAKRHAGSGGGPRRIIALLAVLLLVAAGGAGYFHVTYVAGREALNRSLSQRLALLQRDTQELPTLDAAIHQIERRKGALLELSNRRLLWAVKFDQLADIIPDNIWLRAIRLSEPRSQRLSATGSTLTLECYSAGAEEKGITLFRERLQQNEAFWKDVARINRIQHTRRDFPAYVEGVALEFNVDLQLKAQEPPKPAVPQRRTRTASAQR